MYREMLRMIPIDKDKVASRIALIRKELGLTMKDFGWKVDGVDKSTVSNWEKGKTMPSLKHLELIAEAGKRDVGWLQHGTMESYLPKLIEKLKSTGRIDNINEKQYKELLNVLKFNNIRAGDVKSIVKHMMIIMQERESNTEHNVKRDIDQVTEINDSDPQYDYKIIRNKHFRKTYVPLINDLLLIDEKAYVNDQIILFLIDLLSRMNPSTKEDLLEVIKDMNWLVSNNIFRLNKREQSQIAVYGGIRSGAYNYQQEISYEDVESEAEKIIQNINDKLNNIWKENYKEFQKRDFKSIF